MSIKLNLHLIPGLFITALAPPFMVGTWKYTEGDWQKPLFNGTAKQFIKDRTDSLLRHTAAYQNGEIYDDDGPHHLAAVAWNALLVLWYSFHHYHQELYDAEKFEAAKRKYLKAKAERMQTQPERVTRSEIEQHDSGYAVFTQPKRVS